VVNVDVTSRVEKDDSGSDDPFEQFFGRGRGSRPQVRQGAGSGFVIDPRGYILTNNHVVEGAFNIRVRFDDGRALEAEVLGTDPLTDIALIKLKAPPSNLPTSSSAIPTRCGWATGSSPSATRSVSPPASARASSAPRRGRSAPPSTTTSSRPTPPSIPGNSGGPLFNLRGEVIGINTAIVSGGAGIGFAVPSNLAKALIPQLEKNGKVTRGYIGVKLQNLTPELAKALNVSQSSGALINEVHQEQPG
jgi:serine protease Do